MAALSFDQLVFSLEIAAKAALYASLLPAVGVCVMRSLLLPRLGSRLTVSLTQVPSWQESAR